MAITVNDILLDAYEEAFATSEYKASNTLGLKHLSQIVQRFWNRVVNRRKALKLWSTWDITTTATDAYTPTTPDSTTVGVAHIESVSITYDSTTYPETGGKQYTPCRKATQEEIDDWNYYIENQSNEDPIYYEAGGRVYVAPQPRSSEVGTARIRIKGIQSIASGSWTTATAESAMGVPLFAHDVLKLGLVWKIHSYLRRDRNVIIDAKNEYEREENNALTNMFVEDPFLAQYPDKI